jgi:hypothetical protein
MSAAEGSGSNMPPGPTPAPETTSTPAPAHETPHSENLALSVGLPIAACIFMVFSVLVNSRIQNKSISEIQAKAAGIFEKLTIGGKGGLIVGLMALALVNGHSSYVKDHPKQFMQDSLAIAGFGAIAAGWLTFTRGRPDLLVNHFVFSLMLFFLYHVCREFAGYFTVFGTDKMTEQEKKQQNVLGLPLLIVGGIGFFIALGLAITAHISPDYSFGILNGIGSSAALLVETIVFVLIITMGELVVAKNKKEPLATAAGMSVALFTFAHLVLQGGGFYEHLYGGPPIIS